jgi:hypothetical protein
MGVKGIMAKSEIIAVSAVECLGKGRLDGYTVQTIYRWEQGCFRLKLHGAIKVRLFILVCVLCHAEK